MKNLIVLLSGIVFLTLWSCSSDSNLSSTDATLQAEEVERVVTETEMQEMIASLTDSEKEYVEQTMTEIRTAIKNDEPQRTGAALRAAVIGAVTVAMNVVIATNPCPAGVELDRFRTISSTQTYNPDPFTVHANGDPHACTEPNHYITAVTNIMLEAVVQQIIFGDCDYNPNYSITVRRVGDCFESRLVWRGFQPALGQ